MKSGLPWELKGLRPRARETAQAAARRAGMSVGEWLDTVILSSADDDQDGPERNSAASDKSERHEENSSFTALNDRIDPVAHELSQVAHLTADRAKVNEPRNEEALQELAGLISKLDRRIDQAIAESRSTRNAVEQRVDAVNRAVADLAREQARGTTGAAPATALDRALIEIADRQRALDGYSSASPASGTTPKPSDSTALPRARTQDLSGLEQQLREINRQIENINRPCGMDKAIDGLRDDLAEIGVMVQAAMPRKSLEALEESMRKLSERIDRGRDAGVDAPALGSVEKGLAELREAVRGLGSPDNLARLDGALQELSRKVDGIAQKSEQPASLKGIETALAGMRSTVSHVASNDALASLSNEVRALAGKLDRATQPAAGDTLATLETRIAALADALQARNQAGQSVPSALEDVIKGLAEKIERVQLMRAEPQPLGHLEDRITRLVEKLDASDARLNQLEQIERGLAELLTRTQSHGMPNLEAGITPASVADPLSREVAELQETERKTQESLEIVHGTLGHVVDRLAMIETDMRGNARPLPGASKSKAARAEAPAGNQSARPSELDYGSSDSLFAAGETASEPVKTRYPARPGGGAAADEPLTHEALPPDHPIEPGTARERKLDSPADRIAASESALEEVKATAVSEPTGTSDFIAAARRAAQAAARQASNKDANRRATDIASAAGKLAKRVGKLRTLIVGSSAIALVLGSLEVARILVSNAPDAAESGMPATEAHLAQTEAAVPRPGHAPMNSIPGTPRESSSPERVTPAAETAALGNTAASKPASIINVPLEITRQVSAGVTAAQQPGPETGSDVTGSIPAAATSASTGRTVTATPAIPQAGGASGTREHDGLPAGLGANLRAAALKGDAAAQFEVGVRLADGRAVPQNFSGAAEWFERAARKGLAPAQFRLAGLYEKGFGVKKSLETARRYYMAAGEAGHAKALHNLAVLYAEGIDGKPDYQTAAKWFGKAAGYGVADSQYNLAVLYARGIGVEQNLAESYKWFALAARDGDPEAARRRDDLAARLDQQSLQAAIKAFQSFVPQQQPETALQVKAPPGGWDEPSVSSLPSSKRKPMVIGPKLDLATPSPAQ
jgi:localization factor PodJL